MLGTVELVVESEVSGSPARCTSCGATLAPAAPWCHLCFTPVRTEEPTAAEEAPEPATEPEQLQLFDEFALGAASTAPAGASGETAEGTADAETAEAAEEVRGWPCIQCRHRNPHESNICEACGLMFGLGLQGSKRELPGTRTQRRLIAGGAALLLVLVIGTVLTLLTGGGSGEVEEPPPILPSEAPLLPEPSYAPTNPADQPPAVVFTDIPVPPQG